MYVGIDMKGMLVLLRDLKSQRIRPIYTYRHVANDTFLYTDHLLQSN